MKKHLISFLIIIVIISLNSTSYASNNLQDLKNHKMKGVTLLPSEKPNITKLKELSFNTVFLHIGAVRSVKKPYKTNYQVLKQLYNNIQSLENCGIKYVLCFTSGPGYSADSKVNSIYKNKAEQMYFSQMVSEVLKRYSGKKNLIAISFNLPSAQVDYKTFNLIQSNLIANAQKNIPALPFIYNLHPLTFEDNLVNLPKLSSANLMVNFSIYLKALDYPGYGAGINKSCTLDRNSLLGVLEKLDTYSDNSNHPVMLSIKTPWVDNSEVMLQDLFELFKMIKLDYSLSYGNSKDLFDFTTNPAVLKVVNRYNK